uniref:Uncharacterized protein n=1 Tax=Arundo donax TaxID=35708 RepID=A0A0A8Z2Q5_ARUDO
MVTPPSYVEQHGFVATSKLWQHWAPLKFNLFLWLAYQTTSCAFTTCLA